MKKAAFKYVCLILVLALTQIGFGQTDTTSTTKNIDASKPVNLQLPTGFTARIVAQGIDGARHMAVNKQGGLYIKLSKLKDGNGIIYLNDKDGDGFFDEQSAFGDYPGTGIYIRDNYLYASSNDDVYRYQLDANGEVIHPDKPEKIIVGLVNWNLLAVSGSLKPGN